MSYILEFPYFQVLPKPFAKALWQTPFGKATGKKAEFWQQHYIRKQVYINKQTTTLTGECK
jgi:hypothetical protein